MGDSNQNSLRYLGPVSIAIFAVVVVIVIAISLGGSGDSGGPSADQQQTQQRTHRRFYTVKNGDNLGTISEKTGVSIDEIQALNPEVDPQALIAGQRLKLR